MKLFTILLPLIYTCEYVYICAYVYKSLDCSSYVAIRIGFRVSNRVSYIRGFGFGMNFHPNRCSGRFRVLCSGFDFGCPDTPPDPNPTRCYPYLQVQLLLLTCHKKQCRRVQTITD
jgi:hypothetical protein